MNNNEGFTLIELMIVIAIIGILASIALPQYISYVGRTQAIEGFKVASGLQNEVDLWYNDRKAFPDVTAVAPNGYIGGLADNLQGKYITNNGVTVTADTGVINVPFDAGVNRNTILQLKPYHPNGSKVITWICGGTINTANLPNTCLQP